MADASQKMLKFLSFCALVATSRSGLLLSIAGTQSIEDYGDSGSASVESTDSTLFSVHGVKKPSYGSTVSGGRPATPGAAAEGILSRFGGGGGGGGRPAPPGEATTEGILSRFGGGGGDAFTLAPGNNSQPTTEMPSTTSELSQTVTGDRSKSPIFNIWEFAKIAGPFHVRTGGGPDDFQQTSTSGLNRCEWAIISCCQSRERARRNTCFDALNCRGAWFENPCADRLQQAVYGKLLQVSLF